MLRSPQARIFTSKKPPLANEEDLTFRYRRSRPMFSHGEGSQLVDTTLDISTKTYYSPITRGICLAKRDMALQLRCLTWFIGHYTVGSKLRDEGLQCAGNIASPLCKFCRMEAHTRVYVHNTQVMSICNASNARLR